MVRYPAGRLRPVPIASEFSIASNEDEFSSTIEIGGAFEFPNVSAFDAAMKAALRANGRIVVDLRRCRCVDSRAMMLLANYKQSLAEHLTILVSETGAVRRILEISGLARALGVSTRLPAVGQIA